MLVTHRVLALCESLWIWSTKKLLWTKRARCSLRREASWAKLKFNLWFYIYLIYQWLSDSRWGCAPHTYIVERAARIARVTRFNSPILFSISMRKKNIQWAEKILLRLTVVQTVRFHISFDLQGFLPREKLSFIVVAKTVDVSYSDFVSKLSSVSNW